MMLELPRLFNTVSDSRRFLHWARTQGAWTTPGQMETEMKPTIIIFFYFRYFFGSNVSQFWLDYFISVQFLFCSFHFCHVNAGNKFQLHYPEYYAAYKHGRDGLRQPAPTETVTFEVTILRATNTYSQLQITFHTYLAKCVYALWFSPVVTKPLYCYTGLPCLQ